MNYRTIEDAAAGLDIEGYAGKWQTAQQLNPGDFAGMRRAFLELGGGFLADRAQAAPAEQWALLEIMGHERLAGRISDATVAGVPMLRVEVPATERTPAFERLLAGPSIFSLTPVAESVARIVVGSLQKTAVSGLPAYNFSAGDHLRLRERLGLPALPERTPTRGYGQPSDYDDPSEY